MLFQYQLGDKLTDALDVEQLDDVDLAVQTIGGVFMPLQFLRPKLIPG